MENKSKLPKPVDLRRPQVAQPISKSASYLRTHPYLKKILEQTEPNKPLAPTSSTNSVASQNVKQSTQKMRMLLKMLEQAQIGIIKLKKSINKNYKIIFN